MAGMKQGAEMQEGELAAWLRAQKREAREITYTTTTMMTTTPMQ